ncbi:MAG: bifunctional pyr operon transcriptional regulator/uracil phosphoribosyltransferase PyrR [Verrucomicrobia bacterium]|nr:MAG: bifunctional pyr operon transcriptional regulator/uracil phosphoribosyltransferase PyrR [Verrucomicrobiota bacterium]
MSDCSSQLILAMDAAGISEAVTRMAGQILEKNSGLSRLVIAGIPTRGVELARRLVKTIEASSGMKPDFGIIDVAMHRDDLSQRIRMTTVQTTKLPLDLDNRRVILVDDVLFTGRSCRAALDAIVSFGRPSSIQFAVLVDRGHRELPIHADYVGKHLRTSPEERIRVRFENLDDEPDSVQVIRP